MIKKLQSKFIMIAMASVFIVIVLLIGSINIANFTHTTKKADDLLSMLAENNGRFPEGIEKEGLKPPKKRGMFLLHQKQSLKPVILLYMQMKLMTYSV